MSISSKKYTEHLDKLTSVTDRIDRIVTEFRKDIQELSNKNKEPQNTSPKVKKEKKTIDNLKLEIKELKKFTAKMDDIQSAIMRANQSKFFNSKALKEIKPFHPDLVPKNTSSSTMIVTEIHSNKLKDTSTIKSAYSKKSEQKKSDTKEKIKKDGKSVITDKKITRSFSSTPASKQARGKPQGLVQRPKTSSQITTHSAKAIIPLNTTTKKSLVQQNTSSLSKTQTKLVATISQPAKSSGASVQKPQANKEFINKLLQNIERNKLNVRSPSGLTHITPQIAGTTQNVAVNPMAEYLELINRVKVERKTFTCCGNFPVRRSLLERGWVEKVRISLEDRENWRALENLSNTALIEGMKNKQQYWRYRRALLSKLLAGHQVDLYWYYGGNIFKNNSDKAKHSLINQYPPGTMYAMSNKAGLCNLLQEAHWVCIEGVSGVFFPRTYSLVNADTLHGFIEDFQNTAAISLLQWIVTTAKDSKQRLMSDAGSVPHSVFNFALIQCQQIVQTRQHLDIDMTTVRAKDYEWNIFLERYYKLVHQKDHFRTTNEITVDQMTQLSKQMLVKLELLLPHYNVDGYRNMWILKPQCGSRGLGIMVCRTLKFILETVHGKPQQKYIVQKYIERPFLLYDTKFDIRQWFLVASIPQMTVWMYKECYLRFSSQNFNLDNLHESVHLTNNSIQCRYKNGPRDKRLPEQNMWHCNTFAKYLNENGFTKSWDDVYRSMKEAIVALFMLCQDKLTNRINSFELCGVDFMLSQDLKPYLIEVNSRPAIYASTKITADLCPKVLEDVIKVVVDHARNRRASTGQFELIYTDKNQNITNESTNTLHVRGRSVFNSGNNDISESNILDVGSVPLIRPKSDKDLRNTLEKMLSLIRKQQEKTSLQDLHKDVKKMLNELVDNVTENVKDNNKG